MQTPTQIQGGLFDPSLPGGRAGATAQLTPSTLVAHPDNESPRKIELEKAHVELGGASGRMLFVRSEDKSLTYFSEDPQLMRVLRATAPRTIQEQLNTISAHQARGARVKWLAITLVAAALIGVAAMIPWAIQFGVRGAIETLPFSVDERIGQYAMGSMQLGGPVVKDPKVTQTLETIVERLKTQSPRDGVNFKVTVVDSDIVNAFALPGGYMVVYTGLLEESDDPQQVAGVMAHEMAHVTERHGLQRMAQSLGIVAGVELILGDVAGILALAKELFTLAAVNQYSQGQEAEADHVGVVMMHKAGLDPLALAAFFETLKKEAPEAPPGLDWISTHPDHDKRIQAVTQQAESLGPLDLRPLDVDWKAMQARLARDPRSMDNAAGPTPGEKHGNGN